jgi:hypothetical protein
MGDGVDYREVLKEIDELESMMPDDFLSFDKPNWKAIWQQIRVVGVRFKGTSFPTLDEHQQAWDHSQRLVSNIKKAQEEEHTQWEEKKTKSGETKDAIIYQAELAKPSGPMGDLIVSMATGGLSSALSALLGPFDERKDELMNCSDHLKQGWALLNDNKENMVGQDKKEAYQALYQAQEQLNQAWADYKRDRQHAYDDFQAERQRKHDEWVERLQANTDNLEDRKQTLFEKIARREEIIDNLQEKLDNAYSDDYRDNISGWIDEEEEKLSNLRNKLEDVENWIEENRNKLNS